MKNKEGFTLIELLVVIAIIGILASVVLTSLTNNRNRAALAGSIESVRSAMPFAMECAIRGYTLSAPDEGGTICSEIDEKWPSDLPGSCELSGDSTHATISGCGGSTSTVNCFFDTGACE